MKPPYQSADFHYAFQRIADNFTFFRDSTFNYRQFDDS